MQDKHIHVITRATAKKIGLTRYFPASECKRGHFSERVTCSGSCIRCMKDRAERPDVSEKRKLYSKAHHAANRESRNIQSKEWAIQNKDRLRFLQMEWRRNNPERHKANQRAAQAKRRAACVGSDASEFSRWVSDQPKICYWCEKKCADKFHVDHYKPLSLGGEHSPSNWVIACPECNIRKHNQDPYDYAAKLGRLF